MFFDLFKKKIKPPEERPILYADMQGRLRIDREALHASPGYKRDREIARKMGEAMKTGWRPPPF